MKLLLFFSFSLLFFGAAAQPGPFPPPQKKYGTAQRDMDRNDSSVLAMKKYLEAGNLKSGVIQLSQDNMPCVIPNTRLMAPIPNAWKNSDSLNKKFPGAIPNPVRPLQPYVIPISVPAAPANKS